MSFEIVATDGEARAGVVHTAHGPVPTPAFMPVGTKGTVKGLDPELLRSLGATIVLGNTYHLSFRPGAALVESLARGAPLEGRTSLFVTPGFEFRRTDALVTNFHLPRSTLLALVMAFAGIEATRELYRAAIEERYRFYSFGDAMLVL